MSRLLLEKFCVCVLASVTSVIYDHVERMDHRVTLKEFCVCVLASVMSVIYDHVERTDHCRQSIVFLKV